MATLKDYIRYYKDIRFDEVAFNDLDSLILTQLVYADFQDIIPNDRGRYILFEDAMHLFFEKIFVL